MPHLLALTLLVVSASASAQPARVIDGDSLELAGEDIRLITRLKAGSSASAAVASGAAATMLH